MAATWAAMTGLGLELKLGWFALENYDVEIEDNTLARSSNACVMRVRRHQAERARRTTAPNIIMRLLNAKIDQGEIDPAHRLALVREAPMSVSSLRNMPSTASTSMRRSRAMTQAGPCWVEVTL